MVLTSYTSVLVWCLHGHRVQDSFKNTCGLLKYFLFCLLRVYEFHFFVLFFIRAIYIIYNLNIARIKNNASYFISLKKYLYVFAYAVFTTKVKDSHHHQVFNCCFVNSISHLHIKYHLQSHDHQTEQT